MLEKCGASKSLLPLRGGRYGWPGGGAPVPRKAFKNHRRDSGWTEGRALTQKGRGQAPGGAAGAAADATAWRWPAAGGAVGTPPHRGHQEDGPSGR